MNPFRIDNALIEQALQEDSTDHDVTTLAIVQDKRKSTAVIYAREPGIIAGIPIIETVFLHSPSDLVFKALVEDGARVEPNHPLAQIHGSTVTLLARERVAMNFLQRCSGIATLTRQFIDQIAHTKTRLLDTRKTSPGLRAIEKYAVRVGGGKNHRFSLADMVLIKDNHIVVAGNITEALARIRASSISKGLLIEVETKTLDEVDEAIQGHPDRIMLDNMPVAMIKQALVMIKDRVEVEISGNVTLSNITQLAELGADYISTGAITHSATALDISMEIEVFQ